MPFHGRRSAIVIPVRLPPALEAIRLDHVDNARLGVPAHVTLLFPFVDPAAIDAAVLERAGRAVGRVPAFRVGFREVTSFDPGPESDGVVWLAPEPAVPFVALTESLVQAFPGYLPYGGIHDEVVPHLTLANVDVDVPALEAAARPHLPFRRRASTAVLLVEDDGGRWRAVRRLPLG
jgi:2'-5' RNA ligase